MAHMKPGRQITVIDIGTTSISVIVAHVIRSGSFELLAHTTVPSDGLRKGVIVDINRAVYAIRRAITLAEQEGECAIQRATISISGPQLSSLNSSGTVPISGRMVSDRDIENVFAAARAIRIPNGFTLLHVLPRNFTVDDGQTVIDPRGMYGVRLEASAHIVTCGSSELQNILSCCQRAGISVEDVVAAPLASAEAVLTPDERHLGVALLDIGGGTSDLMLYHHGAIYDTCVLPIAGNHFTNDLAIGLRTTITDAERVKGSCSNVFASVSEQDSPIEITYVDGLQAHRITPSGITRIIRPRAEELLEIVKKKTMQKKFHTKMTAGLVLTGGGAKLKGFAQLAQRMLECPVRIGTVRTEAPLPDELLDPSHATVVGLLLCRLSKSNRTGMVDLHGPLAQRLLSRLRLWISGYDA